VPIEKTLQAIYHSIRFGQAIQDCEWLKNKGFSVGDFNWAMDACAMHNLFKILDVFRPDYVLEYGLGESSKLVHQYAVFYGKAAVTVESDPAWISYIKASNPGIRINCELSGILSITFNGIQTEVYERDLDAKSYDVFETVEKPLIIIDGPPAQFSRIGRPQILNILPRLKREFCILIHDSERRGEGETVGEIVNYFNQNKIEYGMNQYDSTKSHTIFGSKNWKYLTRI